MVIGENTTVSIYFTLKNADGMVLDSSGDRPFEFIFSMGMVVPGLEKALQGMKAGDEKTIVVSPDEGYGKKDRKLFIKTHRDELPEREIKIGQVFRKVFSNGESQVFRVKGYIEDWVYLDSNHPWAGMELHYNVKIVDVKKTVW
ncbi:MAG: FKBP-type peptidyl-prolyl cis-trans isomerase [Thermodesulfobacteriota bacterium]|nr:FKBP-type peptidyl-prolyl cis-trans isomerase [Thermodesulfobacteriota bacterium]